MTSELIASKIHFLRGERILLDQDLSLLYGVETRVLNQAVRRNLKRFPPDFMFELSVSEVANLKSQFVISSWGGRRKLPLAFTEQGIAMLSSVLRSDRAIDVNIAIMRTFVAFASGCSPTKTWKSRFVNWKASTINSLRSSLTPYANCFVKTARSLGRLGSRLSQSESSCVNATRIGPL